jgi:hypothetical protein
MICVAGGACTTLRRIQPGEFLAKNSPDVVWVTQANNTVVPLAQPQLVGDTLRGMWVGTQRPVAIPLNEVGSVRAKVPDRRKTAVLLAGLGVGAVSSVYFLWISKAGPTPNSVVCGFDVRGFPISYC